MESNGTPEECRGGWTIEHLILIVGVLHFIVHAGKTMGNRLMKFIFPHYIPEPRTPLLTASED